MATDELADRGDIGLIDPLVELRRRERQQAIVAELGRLALSGTPLAELLELAVDGAIEALEVERVGLLLPAGDGLLVCRTSRGWRPEQMRGVEIDGASQIAHVFRKQEVSVVNDFETGQFPDSLHLSAFGIASGAAVPVRGEGEAVGVLAAHSTRPNAFGTDQVLFLRAVANLIAVVTARERADELRQRSQDSLAFLAEAGHILSGSLDYDATIATLATLVVPRLADWFIVDLLETDGSFRRVAVRASTPEKQELLEALAREYDASIDGPSPASRAVTSGRTFQFNAADGEDLRITTKDEHHYELMSALDPHAAIGVPLLAGDRIIGALTFAWSESGREYDPAAVQLAEELARRAAIAIENARLYRSEQEARELAEDTQRRLAFLSEAGVLLSSSLDYRATLKKLGELMVPDFTDWCTVVTVEPDGSLERIVVAHSDPERREWVDSFLSRYPVRPDDQNGAPLVIRTGEPMFVPEITREMLDQAAELAEDKELFQILEGLDLRSTVVVPLMGRDRALGALTLATSSGRRPFTEADLEFALELGRRAGNAIENARLYQTAEQGARAAQALAYVADAVILLDAGGRVRYWNPAARTLAGLGHDDALGRPLAELVPEWPDLDDQAQHTVPLVLHGEERWLSISCVDFGEGRVYALRDLTREHALEQMRSDLVATASHELRTPLAAIYGASVTLLREDVQLSEHEQKSFLRMIETEGERLTRIINQILVAGQLDENRLELFVERCDLAELARDVVERVATKPEQRERIDLRADSGVPTIACDADRLRQVLGNLVENAIKYSPDGGRIEVRVRNGERGFVVVEVADEGIGIPPSEHDRIFEKFHRLDPEQTRGVGGTGLGLYITRELVTRMGGRIGVRSEPGRGTTFAVELPA
ncbi:MAG: GAF domain-containing protein [Actinobacteria bacterium]|nr:GAF domain-containing protein [Actinomycetota bacterium]